jgi:small-conductance mechanosensitive channel
MCIAAYLALGGGLGVSRTTAAHLRTVLVWLCWSVLALLTMRVAVRFAKRRATTRTTKRIAAAALRGAPARLAIYPASSNAWRRI